MGIFLPDFSHGDQAKGVSKGVSKGVKIIPNSLDAQLQIIFLLEFLV